MILATDLDGTFLGGKSLHKQQLYRLIRKDRNIQLIFVTGRGLESVIPLLNDPIMPNPDFIICDVGATVVNGHTLEPIDPLQFEIESQWPGPLAVMEALKDVQGLQYQEVPQQRRCSFFTEEKTVIEQVKEKVAGIGCDVIFSAGKYLDVVPKEVNKGKTLSRLIQHIKGSAGKVLVAGDTLNDLSMYHCGFKGVIVGNAEPELVEALQGDENIFISREAGAGGILDAMEAFEDFAGVLSQEIEEVELSGDGKTPQLVMMYHRFPYELKHTNGSVEMVAPKSPNGILPTLQNFFNTGRSGVWIAWEEVQKKGEVLRNIYIDKDKYPNLMASRIGLTKEEINVFYKSFAKEAFWPTIFAFVDKARFNHHHWDHYVNINRLFALKAAEQADPGAIIWIHDYNLWLVPGMLREMRPDLRIGFFHHTAFPAANTFNILPWRREIIGSLLQCDYIGFHVPRYVENFVDVAKSLFPVEAVSKIQCAPRFLTYSTALGVQEMTTTLQTGHRSVGLGAHPVGINVNYIAEVMQRKDILEHIHTIKAQTGDKKLILSVERLDYVKGPLEKILAFEQFLHDYPEFHGKIELMQICTPPAEGMQIYDKIQHDLEHAVGRINGRYSSVDWIPIRFIARSFPFDDIIPYYAVADIAWITPLRDGLNLVAKEYIAVQGQIAGSSGTLILSEFAGAAVELPYAILTNPYDLHSLKESLLQALTLTDADKQLRMQRLFDHVSYFNIDHWANDFLERVSATDKKTKEVLV